MQMLYKILVLILLAAAGFLLVPIIVNLMIKVDMLNAEIIPQGFMQDMLTKSTFVWMGACVIGGISLFIQKSWRITLLLCPLVLPSAFILIYPLIQT